MPFALLIIGLVLLIGGIRNAQDALFSTVKGDFTGPNNFIFWFASIMIIGAIGYIPKLKPVSTAFLLLVVVVLFLRKGDSSGIGGGFFNQFSSAIDSTENTSGGLSLSGILANIDGLKTAISNNINLDQATNIGEGGGL